MKKKKINRRDFINKASVAAGVTIVPRHVIGKGFIAPSDKVTVANIGCGTQGLREMPGMLENQNIQVTAVADCNKYSTDYLDWSPRGIINGIQKTLGNKNWGKYIKGIPGGRDIGQEFVNQYYTMQNSSTNYKACTAYEDYKELLEKEDIDVVKIMTPDHLHAQIAIDAANKGIHVVAHKPIANRLTEGLKVIDAVGKNKVKSHLLAWSDKPNYRLILKWIRDGVIGDLKEIHNWSVRPVWPQFPAALEEEYDLPEGFNWQLWLGPEKDRPYNPNYTHNVFRGWYDFGGGSIADMGHYSLFPLFREFGIETAPLTAKAFGTATRTSLNGVCRAVKNDAAFPYSCMVKFQFPSQKELPAFDLFWYDGGMRPFEPEEMEEDGEEFGAEGMMFVGSSGKILAGFQGDNPRIIPSRKMEKFTGIKSVDSPEPERRSDTWIRAIKGDQESPGSFLHAGPVHETINLGAVALRAKKRIEYNSKTKEISNLPAANKYLSRDYRKGWEM